MSTASLMSTAPLKDLHDLADPSSWLSERVERALRESLDRATGPKSPPRLREALGYAVFPGGGRLRPRLCLGVAAACGDTDLETATAAATAVELVHCASLVHDDMPCFDDADLRRGKPTVHKRFGEATALLVGDALIVLAFETLGRAGTPAQLALLAVATGPSRGIIAGQAWESEAAVPLDEYHRAKTAALFDAAAGMGAIAAGVDPRPWRAFGEAVGRAYQAADDLADAAGSAIVLGKNTGRDAALARPSIVRSLGVEAARVRVRELVDEAQTRVPQCSGREMILLWLERFANRLGAS